MLHIFEKKTQRRLGLHEISDGHNVGINARLRNAEFLHEDCRAGAGRVNRYIHTAVSDDGMGRDSLAGMKLGGDGRKEVGWWWWEGRLWWTEKKLGLAHEQVDKLKRDGRINIHVSAIPSDLPFSASPSDGRKP